MFGAVYRTVAAIFAWLWSPEKDRELNASIYRDDHDMKTKPRDKKGRFVKRNGAEADKICNACLSSCTSVVATGSCAHTFCKGCMKAMYQCALKDRSLIPVKCCGPVDSALYALVLSRSDATTYREAIEDINAKNKMIW
jgi:hypothetical protein